MAFGDLLSVSCISRSNASRSPSLSCLRIISGSCLIHPAEMSTTPQSATAAAKRCSNAIARGTQYPAWLTPISATWSASTSGRARIASRTGVRTASQSWRKVMFCSYSAACCPGPSNVIQW